VPLAPPFEPKNEQHQWRGSQRSRRLICITGFAFEIDPTRTGNVQAGVPRPPLYQDAACGHALYHRSVTSAQFVVALEGIQNSRVSPLEPDQQIENGRPHKG